MKILITGATGLIGASILRKLQLNNYEVIVIGRNRPKQYDGVFFKINLIESSEFKLEKILKEIKASHLIHLAWYTEHGKFWDSKINNKWVEKTAFLVEKFCNAGGKSVIAAGSCAEYSWKSENKLLESAECKPESLYGISKNKTRELLTKICCNAEVNLTWCRIFFPYGPKDNEEKLIPQLKKVASGIKKPFLIKQPGSRDFIHVDDIANAFLIIMKKKYFGIINICNGISYDLNELMQKVIESSQAEAIDIDNLNNNENITNIVGENKILVELGWKPKRELYSYIIKS